MRTIKLGDLGEQSSESTKGVAPKNNFWYEFTFIKKFTDIKYIKKLRQNGNSSKLFDFT